MLNSKENICKIGRIQKRNKNHERFRKCDLQIRAVISRSVFSAKEVTVLKQIVLKLVLGGV